MLDFMLLFKDMREPAWSIENEWCYTRVINNYSLKLNGTGFETW